MNETIFIIVFVEQEFRKWAPNSAVSKNESKIEYLPNSNTLHL
jgi:hypothetical protein